MEILSYSPSQFDKLEAAWKKLESGKDMTVFQKYDWFIHINNLYSKEHIKKPFRNWVYLLALDDNNNPLMIAPIQIVKLGLHYKSLGISRGAYFIGRQGYSDYLNFIYYDFDERVAEEILQYVQTEYGVKRFCFEQLLDDTELHKYLIRKYQYHEVSNYCAALVLPKTFEEYKKRLSKSTRQNIRTAINRQKRDSITLTHEFVYDLDDSDLEKLLQIRNQRLGEKKKKAEIKSSRLGRIYNRLRNILRHLVDAKHDVIRECCDSWAFLVKDGDRIASYFWGLMVEERGEYYVILAGVDKDYAWYSPSISHLYLFLQEQYESNNNQIKVLDFTRGGERYKTDMGGEKKDAWTIAFWINKRKN